MVRTFKNPTDVPTKPKKGQKSPGKPRMLGSFESEWRSVSGAAEGVLDFVKQNYSSELVNSIELANMLHRDENLGNKYLIQRLYPSFEQQNTTLLRVYYAPLLQNDDIKEEKEFVPKVMFTIRSKDKMNF